MRIHLAAATALAAFATPTSLVHAQDVPSAAEPMVVNYTDPYDGTALMGYWAMPSDASSENRKPAVVILPDWDGVNEYEWTRASMIATQLGYVAIAADVYGLENHQPESIEERIALTSLYRGNLTLYASRLTAAVNLAKSLDVVDSNLGLGAVGYCFGGTGVLNFALGGYDEGLHAVIAFHGGLSGVTFPTRNTTVFQKVLILSGGEDTQDSTASVMEMEARLDAGNSTWELTRYSDVEHGFTNFLSSAYNEYVDERSWNSFARFINETFAEVQGKEGPVAELPDQVTVESVEYTDVDGTMCVGSVAYPGETEELLPAVVIVHDADGRNEYEETRAQMIANLGYVGFALDIYGGTADGVDFENRTQRSALMDSYRDDVPLFMQRINAGITAAIATGRVDPERIVIIGYCFGGTGVINYAMVGESGAKGIVSYHGGLSNRAPVGEKINTRMMIQSGGADDEASDIEALEEAMKEGLAPSWEYSRYSGVEHAFTEKSDLDRYSPRADVRSWESMKTFLADVFDDSTPELTDLTASPVFVSSTMTNSPTMQTMMTTSSPMMTLATDSPTISRYPSTSLAPNPVSSTSSSPSSAPSSTLLSKSPTPEPVSGAASPVGVIVAIIAPIATLVIFHL
jgi:dienelactone hydrolase